MSNKILGLIPTRSGSKRLKGKNILDICGKPLIAWSIEAANKYKYINTVVNSHEILKIAKNFGPSVILRSSRMLLLCGG